MKKYYLKNYKNNSLKVLTKKFSLLLKQVDYILSICKPLIKKITIDKYELELHVRNTIDCYFLLYILAMHTNTLFTSVIDIVTVDYPGKKNRFKVIYLLLSVDYNVRLRLSVETNEVDPLYSITGLFAGASWMEREVWDMFGIFFVAHPDLRRILTDYGFEGHPLRKDFPLTGYVELFYDDSKKRIVYEPVSLAQEYRNFDFVNPWN